MVMFLLINSYTPGPDICDSEMGKWANIDPDNGLSHVRYQAFI